MGSEYAAPTTSETKAATPTGRPARRLVVRRSMVVARCDDAKRVADALAARPPASGARQRDAAAASAVASRIRRASSPSSLDADGPAGAAGPEGGLVDASTATRIRSSTGVPMTPAIQQEMGSAFGVDFGKVRIHTGPQADRLGSELGARAFTVGSDMFFRSGEYQPETTSGRRVLAHELTHTIQQSHGAVSRVRRADEDRDVGRAGGAVPPVSAVVLHSPGGVIQRLRWRGKDGVSDKTIDEAYDALKARLQKTWKEADVREALRVIDADQKGKPDDQMPDWIGLQQLLKEKMGATTIAGKEAADNKARQVFADCVETKVAPTIKQVKEYLETPELKENPLHETLRNTASALADMTYRLKATPLELPASVAAAQAKLTEARIEYAKPEPVSKAKFPKGDPRFELATYLTPEAMLEYEQFRKESKAQPKPPEWKDVQSVPQDLFTKISDEEARKQRERQELQRRGLPPALFDEKLTSGVTAFPSGLATAQLDEFRKTVDALHPASAKDVVKFLVTDAAPTAPLRYLRDRMIELLLEIGQHASNLKASAKQAMLKLVQDKCSDIADAKGAVGELNAVLFAAKQGTDVNTGGKKKPLPGGKKIGTPSKPEPDQEVDVRYVKDTNVRVHMEAKWDAATLINTYEGESRVKGEKKEKSYQELRYEALRGKPVKEKGRIKERGLEAIVSNPHDWLRLFVPGSGGMQVSKWLAADGWTLVIKDRPLKPDVINELLKAVPDFVTFMKFGSAPEWADKTSPGFPDPLGFLKYANAVLSTSTTGATSPGLGVSGASTGFVDPGKLSPSPVNAELVTFLSSLDAKWDETESPADNPMIVGVGPGVMSGAVKNATKALPVSGEIDVPETVRFLTNSGKGALCYVYAVVMGLTGGTQLEVEDVVQEIARSAGALGGWIASDSPTASNVLAAVERTFGVEIQVVELQKSDQGTWISGRSHDVGAAARRPIIVRNTGSHYDAIV